MKVKIFVDWRNSEIYTEKSIEEEKKNILDDVISDNYDEILDEYLDENYSLVEIYNLNKDAKIKIREIMIQKCKEKMEEIIENDFEEITLEI